MMDFLITKDVSHPVAELFVLAEENIWLNKQLINNLFFSDYCQPVLGRLCRAFV